MSEICQFVINDRADHSDQLTTAMEVILRLCNGKIDETDEKVVVLREDGKGLREKVRETERK